MEFESRECELKNFAYNFLKEIADKESIVFLGVGCDKFVCDSLGVIVCELLKHRYNIPSFVYGSLEYNIDAKNLVEAVNYIEAVHEKSSIVLIDSTFGDNAGKIRLNKGVFAGLGKTLPVRKFGDVSILGVVGKSRNFNLNSLHLKSVKQMAEFIAKGIAMAMWVKANFCKKS